jgi:cytochrome c-type biogenesis protein CcmH/NrfG
LTDLDLADLLGTVRFLLLVLVVVVGVLVIVLAGIFAHLAAMKRQTKSATGVHLKKSDVAELLAEGKPKSAKLEAIEWLKEQPKNPEACMLLAKAHFQLNEMVEAKSVLQNLLEFAPDMEFYARPYLERIESSIKSTRPRAVD